MVGALAAALGSRSTGSTAGPNEFRISVKRGNGTVHEVMVHPKLTVHELNETLGHKFYVDNFAIRLVHQRRMLKPHNTIEQSGLVADTVLQMVTVCDGAAKRPPPPQPPPEQDHHHHDKKHHHSRRKKRESGSGGEIVRVDGASESRLSAET